MTEKKVIKRENWISNFILVGVPKLSDYTYKIDEQSQKSSWIYNSLNLGVDCGEKHGVVYCEMIGGYSPERENVLYCHGKDGDGKDDFTDKLKIDWEDRLDEGVLDAVGKLSFINVGLEKTDNGKTYYKSFLSEYDAIAYIKEHLTEDMVVSVKGQLKYSLYQDNVQVRKSIQSIILSKVDDTSKYAARFTQTILLDKDSASLKNIDKDKSVMYVDAQVLDYLKEYNGIEVKGQYPFAKQFEFEMDLAKQDICKKIMEKVFKVKKGITQITFNGDLIEGGATVTATWDDVPTDIKDLVDIGVYTKEEAVAQCSASGNRERRMVLRQPYVKLVGEEGTPVLQKFENKYEENDLVLDYLHVDTDGEEDDELPFDADIKPDSDDGSDMGWLNDL